ncbi:hypothetical protein [Mycolicibacter heraklionensis]|uniref:hypothetical protein n=1 Tax=Mycolicibacter heraklionensis TaxID=512402 RepID=UPI000A8C5BFA|nr:hypothetical protein [Mycolicibacter heraklionensis]
MSVLTAETPPGRIASTGDEHTESEWAEHDRQRVVIDAVTRRAEETVAELRARYH